MAALDRRLDRIEAVYGAGSTDLVARLHAGRTRWALDPVAAAQKAQEQRLAFRAGCEATLAAGQVLGTLQGRLMRAHERLASFGS